ncbi:MAG TPA: DUF3080 family protein [Pseudomonadales bacterium]|nr:DUF3080 family protein [Pseudomonadales bacterium]
MRAVAGLFGLVFVPLLLTACAGEDPATALLADYRERMARVLDVDAPPLEPPALAPWPRPRVRTVAIPEQRVDLLDFLDLQACGLGPLIAERSSALGRVKEPSQRLRYELEFLARADACLTPAADAGNADAGPDDETRALLAELLDAKRAALGAVIWNATLGDAALAADFALDVQPLAPTRVRGAGREATGAVHRLAQIAAQGGQAGEAPGDDWEAPWAALAHDRFGGRARRSVALLTAVLADVADWLEARERERPLCPLGRPTPDARILLNLFTRYYAGAVQPYLAAVSTETQRWLDALAALLAAQRLAPPAEFEAAVAGLLGGAGRGTEWQALVAARDRHTRAWQTLLGACDLAPRRPAAARTES